MPRSCHWKGARTSLRSRPEPSLQVKRCSSVTALVTGSAGLAFLTKQTKQAQAQADRLPSKARRKATQASQRKIRRSWGLGPRRQQRRRAGTSRLMKRTQGPQRYKVFSRQEQEPRARGRSAEKPRKEICKKESRFSFYNF